MNEKQAKEMLRLLGSINDRLGALLKQTDPKRQRPVEVVERPGSPFIGRR